LVDAIEVQVAPPTGSSSLALQTLEHCLCCITCFRVSSGGSAAQPALILKRTSEDNSYLIGHWEEEMAPHVFDFKALSLTCCCSIQLLISFNSQLRTFQIVHCTNVSSLSNLHEAINWL